MKDTAARFDIGEPNRVPGSRALERFGIGVTLPVYRVLGTEVHEIPLNREMAIHGSLTIELGGQLVVNGRLVLA